MKNVSNITVSVVMPLFNSERYLDESVQSILGQSHQRFELICVLDPCSDNTLDILNSYRDKRIRIIKNGDRLGLAASLNKGLSLCNGDYIARMDSDDVSLPRRLEEQTRFLELNPDIVACGCYVKEIGRLELSRHRYPITHGEILGYLAFNTPFAHPSVMMRAQTLRDNNLKYSEMAYSEDYEMWNRLSKVGRLANLRKVLLYYRHLEKQQEKRNSKEQRETSNAIRRGHILQLGIKPSADELCIHEVVSEGDTVDTLEMLGEAEKWLLKLVAANNEYLRYPNEDFRKCVSNFWDRTCADSSLGVRATHFWFSSPLSRYTGIIWLLKILVKPTLTKCFISGTTGPVFRLTKWLRELNGRNV